MNSAFVTPIAVASALVLGSCAASTCEPAFRSAGYQAQAHNRVMVQGAKSCHWSHSQPTELHARRAAFAQCLRQDSDCRIVAVNDNFTGKTAAEVNAEGEQLGREMGSLFGDLLRAILSQ